MLTISRRYLLKLLLATGFISLVRTAQAIIPSKSNSINIDSDALNACLDRLIPADDTPGAVQLGVIDLLMAKSQRNTRYANLLSRGCDWLNHQAQLQGHANYFLSPVAVKEVIIQKASESPKRSLPGFFFNRVWNDACFYYYSHPVVLKALPYAGPPQPFGFPDHTLPPVTNKLSDNDVGPQ